MNSLVLFRLRLKEHAFESSQKYKEGKYIIELIHMIKDNGWDDQTIDQRKCWQEPIDHSNRPACHNSDVNSFFILSSLSSSRQ